MYRKVMENGVLVCVVGHDLSIGKAHQTIEIISRFAGLQSSKHGQQDSKGICVSVAVVAKAEGHDCFCRKWLSCGNAVGVYWCRSDDNPGWLNSAITFRNVE